MKFARLMLGASLAALCSAGPAFAQSAAPSASEAATYEFNIPEQPLAAALNSFAQTADVQFAYSADLVSERSGRTLQGRYTVQEALARLLAGTGLTWHFGAGKAIVLDAAGPQAGDGERVLGAVRVQGAQGSGLPGGTVVNGVNGSRDVTATEGTGSYTSNALTVGSKTAQSIKDTPMAVSVITSERIQDQNITDLNAAMRDAPGITVVHDTANDLSFYSRGFQVSQLQIDGGAAQNFAANTSFYRPIIDMSLYDHVEIVRGATGTFNAYGDPGGVLNLVRKRPLDHPQMLIEMQLGAWKWHRESADVTGPIAFDGKLRARIIATNQGNDYFYNVAKASLNLVSGTLELDATSTTLVTAGLNYQDQHDTPWTGGLPRYLTGDPIPLPRSTCLCFPWARYSRTNVEYFGQVEQGIGDNWNLKVKATRIFQRSLSERPYSERGVDPATGEGAQIYLGNSTRARTKQTMIEATLDGHFQLFGQTQKIILGANYSMFDPSGSVDYDPPNTTSAFIGRVDNFGYPVGDITKFNPYDWIPSTALYSEPGIGYEYADFRYINAYASLELTPFARFHVNSALRYSMYRNRSLMYGHCTPDGVANNWNDCTVLGLGAKYYFDTGRLVKGSQISWPPSVQVKYDLSDNMMAYAAYTDIYIDRSSYITKKGDPLPPTTGGNFEGGLKWLSPTKKLNITLSGYYTKQVNTDSVSDPFEDRSTQNIGQLNQQIYCCYFNVNGAYRLSYGADLEISGEIAKRWQLSASYTFNINRSHQPGSVYFDGSTKLLQSQSPKHLAKLWTTYEFGENSPLQGLRIGFGANLQSKTFRQDIYCPQEPLAIDPINGIPYCAVDYVNVFFTDPGHVVFNASLGYKLSAKLRVDAEFENLLDKTYFETVGGLFRGNWYGSPRAVKVSLRGKF